MDGDISVDSGRAWEAGLLRPLYGAQYPVKKGVEGLAGTCCWLAVRNTSFVPVC